MKLTVAQRQAYELLVTQWAPAFVWAYIVELTALQDGKFIHYQADDYQTLRIAKDKQYVEFTRDKKSESPDEVVGIRFYPSGKVEFTKE